MKDIYVKQWILETIAKGHTFWHGTFKDRYQKEHHHDGYPAALLMMIARDRNYLNFDELKNEIIDEDYIELKKTTDHDLGMYFYLTKEGKKYYRSGGYCNTVWNKILYYLVVTKKILPFWSKSGKKKGKEDKNPIGSPTEKDIEDFNLGLAN